MGLRLLLFIPVLLVRLAQLPLGIVEESHGRVRRVALDPLKRELLSTRRFARLTRFNPSLRHFLHFRPGYVRFSIDSKRSPRRPVEPVAHGVQLNRERR